MWHDDSGTIPEVLDPEKSTVADSVAFWSLPCPEVNPDHCALVQPFGTWINNASENKEAAWLLVQYLTSKDVQAPAAQAKALLTPSRLSVLQDPATVAALPPTFPEALTHILQHPNVTLLPFIPEGVAIIPPIQQGLSGAHHHRSVRSRRSWRRWVRVNRGDHEDLTPGTRTRRSRSSPMGSSAGDAQR